ncbi:hypothetical protein [Streptomyces lydicus]|uniref:hypothetical protein n=1 Tax=Streptomyces lydicus TaxID=47763 RepID=UPI0013E37FA8|nr:hypothetical protein [Streptomyces lydicus]
MGAAVLHAPLEYRIHRNPGTIVFDIAVYWTTWSPGGPGWATVEQGLARLAEEGWVRD